VWDDIKNGPDSRAACREWINDIVKRNPDGSYALTPDNPMAKEHMHLVVDKSEEGNYTHTHIYVASMRRCKTIIVHCRFALFVLIIFSP